MTSAAPSRLGRRRSTRSGSGVEARAATRVPYLGRATHLVHTHRWLDRRRGHARARARETADGLGGACSLAPVAAPSVCLPQGPRSARAAPASRTRPGASGQLTNQKNRRAQNDLGRRPSTAQARRRGPWRRTRTSHKNEARDDWATVSRSKLVRGPTPRGFGHEAVARYRLYTCQTGSFVLFFPLDLTSGGPARGLHAPPGPNGLLRGPSCSSCTGAPHRPLTYPACRFLFLASREQSTHSRGLKHRPQ